MLSGALRNTFPMMQCGPHRAAQTFSGVGETGGAGRITGCEPESGAMKNNKMFDFLKLKIKYFLNKNILNVFRQNKGTRFIVLGFYVVFFTGADAFLVVEPGAAVGDTNAVL